MKKRIILASASESRKKAMQLLGIPFKIKPSEINEAALKEKNPEKRVLRLAQLKAQKIALKEKKCLVIGSDLIVSFKGKIFEKPGTKKEAFEMLQAFSGNSVEIIAGLAVIDSESKKMISKTEKCTAKFKKLSPGEINNYIKKYPVKNFSGAFDGDAVLLFAESIKGSPLFFNALPLAVLSQMLKEMEVV